MYELRLLDPASDLPLFEEAYEWRSRLKKHAQPDRMSFETFTDPAALAIGLFNGEFCAVYWLWETEPKCFEAHFTSKRGTPRSLLLTGAGEVIENILAHSGTEIHAWVTTRNGALRHFLKDLQFVAQEESQITCQPVSGCPTLPTDAHLEHRSFVKYVLRTTPNRTQ